MSRVIYSSKSTLWATPKELFNKINHVFSFEIDVCAVPENAKCKKFFSPNENGLDQTWTGICWMNPPYGKELSLWVKKAYISAKENGATVVCLLPARTDTKWWHLYCLKGEVYFLKGRLKFNESKNNAPFPSVIVVFRPEIKDIFL